MNRVRGDGGRFYSTEELQELAAASQQAVDGADALLGANMFKLEKDGDQVSVHASSDSSFLIITIIIMSFAPISSKIKLSGATKPRD